jgi:hypothetical protein
MSVDALDNIILIVIDNNIKREVVNHSHPFLFLILLLNVSFYSRHSTEFLIHHKHTT